jgi:hypothetical protein
MKNNQTSLPHYGVVAVLTAAACLSACVVQERVYSPPPPPPRYSPPPPPPPAAYDEPAGDIEVRATQPPPPLPDYEQPPCPEDGYLWTPGYWHWSGSDYYWVPGTWVQPPRVGVLWTPGYWAFVGGAYGWHAGYWGPHVGFYGGVNYGYGYVGVGYVGGRWDGDRYHYNRSVNNVNTTVIHNTYNQTVVNNITVNKVSYNGGSGGVAAAPSAQERVALREQHVAPTPVQREHVQEAARNPALAAQANGGHPAIAATPRPAAFNGPGVVGARGAAAPPPRAPMTGGFPRQPPAAAPGPGQPNGAPNGARSGERRACSARRRRRSALRWPPADIRRQTAGTAGGASGRGTVATAGTAGSCATPPAAEGAARGQEARPRARPLADARAFDDRQPPLQRPIHRVVALRAMLAADVRARRRGE